MSFFSKKNTCRNKGDLHWINEIKVGERFKINTLKPGSEHPQPPRGTNPHPSLFQFSNLQNQFLTCIWGEEMYSLSRNFSWGSHFTLLLFKWNCKDFCVSPLNFYLKVQYGATDNWQSGTSYRPYSKFPFSVIRAFSTINSHLDECFDHGRIWPVPFQNPSKNT